MNTYNKQLKVKIALATCLATLLFTGMATALVYFYVSGSFRDNAARSLIEMANQAAAGVTAVVDKEMELAKVAAPVGADLMPTRPLDREGEKVLGIIVTDKSGALVASSGAGEALYKANESWWRGAFELVKTAGLVTDVVSEKTSNIWTVPFIAPVRDENRVPIGMLGVFVDVSVLFKSLAGFGTVFPIDVFVVDDKGYTVYRPGTAPFSCKFSSYNELQELLQSPLRWLQMKGVYLQKGSTLAAFADIAHPLFATDKSSWRVIVVRPLSDILQPVKSLMLIMILFALALVLVSFFAALVLGEMLMKPVKILRDGMQRIGGGDLGHRIELSTGDEMEELAEDINDMAANMTKTTTSVSELEKETALRRKAENIRLDIIAMVSRLQPSLETINTNVRKFLGDMAGRLGEKERALLGPACDELDKVSASIKNLADIAGVEAGKGVLTLVPTDIKTILRKNLFAFEPKIRGKGLELKLEIPRAETVVNADAAKIISAFNILVECALKSTERGHIKISVKDEREEIECSVSYTGAVLPESDMQLDLSVARDIIDIHKGQLRAENIPGKEPAFIFTLPKFKK